MAIITITRKVSIVNTFSGLIMTGEFPARLFIIIFRVIEVTRPVLRTKLAVEQSFQGGHRTIMQVRCGNPDTVERRSDIPGKWFKLCRVITFSKPALVKPVK